MKSDDRDRAEAFYQHQHCSSLIAEGLLCPFESNDTVCCYPKDLATYLLEDNLSYACILSIASRLESHTKYITPWSQTPTIITTGENNNHNTLWITGFYAKPSADGA